jgi:hypothetical protein
MTTGQLLAAIATIVSEFGDTFTIDRIEYGEPIEGESYEALAWFFVTGKESGEEATVVVSVDYAVMIV